MGHTGSSNRRMSFNSAHANSTESISSVGSAASGGDGSANSSNVSSRFGEEYQEPLTEPGKSSTMASRKLNSCWTLYLSGTASRPNLRETLNCVAKMLFLELKRNSDLGLCKSADIFLEQLHPLDRDIPVEKDPKVPDQEEVFRFLYELFLSASLTAESAVITMVYVERMVEATNVFLAPSNWKRIVLGGLLMASKVWDDQAVWNVDFCSILPDVDVEDMNELERFYLRAIKFNVSVKASLYAKCYFTLREFAERNAESFPLQPLSEMDAKTLEAQTAAFSDNMKALHDPNGEKILRKSKSENMYFSKSPQAAVM